MRITSIYMLIFVLSGCSFLETNTTDTSYVDSYKKIDNPKQYIESEFALAKEENKAVLFILGGNWCHDSRGLAKKLNQASLSGHIAKNYRLSLVNVGFLEDGFEFIHKTDMKTYYATPTVLIFDPDTGKHLNKDDMHQWANADKVSQSETNNYFKKYSGNSAEAQINKPSISDLQRDYLDKLNDFITVQELRIKAGYKVVGPLLEQYKQGNNNKNFDPYWDAVANLRLGLPDDIANLKKQILSAADTDLQSIVFPEYKPFPWE